MANPKAHERLTSDTAWWGFAEDEALMESVRHSARKFCRPGIIEAEDLEQEAMLWLATRESYDGIDQRIVVERKIRDWAAKAASTSARTESWREWNDQWD